MLVRVQCYHCKEGRQVQVYSKKTAIKCGNCGEHYMVIIPFIETVIVSFTKDTELEEYIYLGEKG